MDATAVARHVWMETFAQLVKFFIFLITNLSPKKWLFKANMLIILDI